MKHQRLLFKAADFEAQKLIGEIAGGNRNALGLLYDLLGGFLFSLAHRITGSQQEAEQVIGEVFLTAWEKAGDHDSHRSKPIAWLTLLVRNKSIVCARAARFTGKHRDSLSSNTNRVIHSTIPRSPTAHDNDVSQLDYDQRQALELAFFDGFTHSEISTLLHEPPETVTTRIRRGLDILRLGLEPLRLDSNTDRPARHELWPPTQTAGEPIAVARKI